MFQADSVVTTAATKLCSSTYKLFTTQHPTISSSQSSWRMCCSLKSHLPHQVVCACATRHEC